MCLHKFPGIARTRGQTLGAEFAPSVCPHRERFLFPVSLVKVNFRVLREREEKGETNMAVVTITNDNFEQEVLACKIPVVLDFWAEWCGPCQMQGPIIEALSEELESKVKFGKVNVDEEAALALKYQIMSIPTIIVMQYGLFKNKAIGLQQKENILEMLKECGE